MVDRVTRIAAWGVVAGAMIVLAFQLLSVIRMLASAFDDPRAGGWVLRLIFLMEVPTVAFPILVAFGGALLFRSLRVSKRLFVAALCVWFVFYGIRTLGIRVQTYHISVPLEFLDVFQVVLAVAGLLIVRRARKHVLRSAQPVTAARYHPGPGDESFGEIDLIRLAWATDLHLNTVKQPDIDRFCDDVLAADVTAMLIGGDISEARDLERRLELLDSRLRMPIYFVLGNHDYYGGDIATVRGRMRQLDRDRLQYLPVVGQLQLSPDLVLVGHDGWGDARIGDLDRFEILTDYMAIQDLRETVNPNDLLSGFFERAPLRRKLGELGDEAADTLSPDLLRAADTGASVLILTHVPPFREACWHEGPTSTATWLPGFTCRAIGDLLDSVAERHPDSAFTVLCGHTHGSGYVRMRPNLDVYTGFGDYGALHFGIVHADGKTVKIELPEGP